MPPTDTVAGPLPVTIAVVSPRTLTMPLDIVVVMDPIGSIKIAKDTTNAMLL